MTNENPKGCGAHSTDTGASRFRRAPDIDEDGRAAKTRKQQGGRRTYSRSEIGDGDIGGEGEPMGDDESSGSIQNRARGDGTNDDGGARDGSGARGAAAGAEAMTMAEPESKVITGAATAKAQTPVTATWAKPTTTRTMAVHQTGRQI